MNWDALKQSDLDGDDIYGMRDFENEMLAALINREKGREYSSNNREKMNAYSRKWQREHPEYGREKARQRYARNPEYSREKARQWYRAHPEVSRMREKTRRAREFNAAGADYLTQEKLDARWDYYGRKCYLCGADATATDHVKPLARGGAQWPCNLRPICKRCNSIKHATWPYDFEKHRELVKQEGKRCAKRSELCVK